MREESGQWADFGSEPPPGGWSGFEEPPGGRVAGPQVGGYLVGRGCVRIRGIGEVGWGFLGWGVREERTGDMGSRDTRGGSQQGRGDSGQQGPVF